MPVIANSLHRRRARYQPRVEPESPATAGRDAASRTPFPGRERERLWPCEPDRSSGGHGLVQLKLGALRSIVSPRRPGDLPAWGAISGPRASFLRGCRAGFAAFGTLVEVVNEGGLGSAPSRVLGGKDSLSTALGGL